MASLLVFCSSVQIEHGSPPVCILNCACYNVFWDLLLVSIYGHKNTDSRTDKCMSAITVSLKCHSNCARYRITSVSKFNMSHFAIYEKISFYQIVIGKLALIYQIHDKMYSEYCNCVDDKGDNKTPVLSQWIDLLHFCVPLSCSVTWPHLNWMPPSGMLIESKEKNQPQLMKQEVDMCSHA